MMTDRSNFLGHPLSDEHDHPHPHDHNDGHGHSHGTHGDHGHHHGTGLWGWLNTIFHFHGHSDQQLQRAADPALVDNEEIVHLEEVVTTWEKAATTRIGKYISDIEKRAILKAHDLLGEPSTALEIGCEGGRWSKMLAELHWNMICTEVNETALALCQERIPSAKCILADPNATAISCPSDSVDLLLCIEVPQVIQAEWFINESFRVLKKNGIMISVDHNLFSYRGLLAYMKATLTGGRHFYKNIYPLWKKKVLEQGFEVLYEEGFCWFPFNRFSNSAVIPYFTQLEKGLGLRKLTNLSPWIVSIVQKK